LNNMGQTWDKPHIFTLIANVVMDKAIFTIGKFCVHVEIMCYWFKNILMDVFSY
jgi:hypothetical protein